MEYNRSREKPCKACTDFKSFMKVGPKKETKVKECPPDVNEIGRGSWTLLHTMSVYLPENELSTQQKSDVKNFMSILSRYLEPLYLSPFLIQSFFRTYPCFHCADDLKKDLKEDPPKVQTGKEYAQWLCQLHNKVNVKLGKPEFDCSKVYDRWRDGSCD